MALGLFFEEREEVCHEGELGLGAGFPAEVEGGEEVAELLPVEDHAGHDALHEGLEGFGC